MTDDGRAEAFVRLRRASHAQVRGQTLDAVKEYLVIYSFDEAHHGRVFGAEVARRVGADGITNVVESIRNRRNAQIVIDAGNATGAWNAQTYPFRVICRRRGSRRSASAVANAARDVPVGRFGPRARAVILHREGCIAGTIVADSRVHAWNGAA